MNLTIAVSHGGKQVADLEVKFSGTVRPTSATTGLWPWPTMNPWNERHDGSQQ